MTTDPKSATNEELQIQAETLAQLLGAAILRLKELGEKSWELPPYAKRLVSNVESVAGGSQPVDREHERRYETVETLDGTHDAEIPAVRPNSTPHPAPSAASGLHSIILEARCRLAETAISGATLTGHVWLHTGDDVEAMFQQLETALRSHQAPVGEDKDGERYRWFNKNYDFLAYVRGEDGQKTYRLRCGEPLNAWIDREIEKERARQAAAPSPQTGGGS